MLKFKYLLFITAILLIAGCSNKTKDSNRTGKIHKTVKDTVQKSYGFYFVGMTGKNPGIYHFNSEGNSYKIFWSSDKEKVVDLSYSNEKSSIFFLTSTDYGKNGVFPFINNIKLYLLNPDSSKVKFITAIGSGLQVFTAWSVDNSYKVVLNSFDTTVADYVNQHTLILSEFGKILLNETKTFNIVKEGYPRPPEIPISRKSPDSKYTIFTPDSLSTTIYLESIKNGKKVLITQGEQKLNHVEWTPDGKYLIFSTLNITPRNETLYKKNPSTSQIFLYSLTGKKILQKWGGGGIKNFYIKNGLLIFDDGFSNNSTIKIYDYNSQKLLKTIKVKGGCGLRNIPVIPDYSA